MPEKNVLTDVEIDEVSYVGKGANKKTIIFKSISDEDGKMAKVKKQPPEEEEEEEELEEEPEVEKPEKKPKKGGNMEDKTVSKTIEEIEKEFNEKLEKMKADQARVTDAIKKDFEEKLAIEKAQKEDIEKALEIELSKRILNEQIGIAKADYGNLGKPEEIAPLMKEVGDKVSPETFGKLASVLKTANQRIQATLFTEVGKSGHIVGGSAADKVRGIAKSMIEKSGTAMTMAEAEARVWIDHPELASEYQAEYRRALPSPM